MNLQKYFQPSGRLIIIISSALLLNSLPVMAQPLPVKVSLNFPSGDAEGAPKRTSGGGRRSGFASCIQNDKEKPYLTALMPRRDNKSLTISKAPTLYFYVPRTKATVGEFILRDINNDQEDIYQITFKLPNQPGIIKLQLPQKVALKTGSTYKWFFSIICDSEERSSDEYTEGEIKRINISSSVNQAIQKATPLKQAQIYAKYDLWPETITNIDNLRSQSSKEWQELLKSVGLGVIAEEPIIEVEQSPIIP